ncbi:MAG TPA: NADH-quinone oxidoreductase subunit G [Mycobacteriales bacterium]|nr:NADH-quinone oxidoreductase subunit G [Mycobacteriales bacterium]
MTLASQQPAGTPAQPHPTVDLVTLTIDGVELRVPKGTLIIRAAELLGVQVPRFCDHPLLEPVGACRQCIVEVEGQRKPVASCTVTVSEGMVVKTQLTSPVAEKAQAGTMEMLLINHPLDCPVCDKGGECPLQNQAMTNGAADSRFHDVKRTFVKPLAISSQVLLDRERCVLCARCTRFSQQIAGDPFIELFERGANEQVGISADEPFESYFSGNTVQICPVGALTGASYRFRSRPFDLESGPSVCEHCASGCAVRSDHRRGKVLRRLAGDEPEVNEEWNCDKGRWAFRYVTAEDRLLTPLVRAENGALEEASWPAALDAAARGLTAAAAAGRVGVLTGGRLTLEDAYAYAKFARLVLHTDDIDFRARPSSAEEAAFLGHAVAGRGMGVTYRDLERAGTVVLAGLEPEEESPIVFLRLRKAVRQNGLRVVGLAPYATRGLSKLAGALVETIPGTEPAALDGLELTPDSILLVGERLAAVPGALSAAVRAAERSGARLAWVPRRAGERGAVEAGLLPGLLPFGRSLASPADRAGVGSVWGVDVPELSTGDLLAPHTGYLLGGLDLDDLPDPAAARAALGRAFVVSLELRPSSATVLADVVLPVAAAVEKAGTFVDWEGRMRPFEAVLTRTGSLPDTRVLHMLADEMGCSLGLASVDAARAELEALATAPSLGAVDRPAAPDEAPAPRPTPAAGQAVLATHHHLLDEGSLSDGEEHLAGTRPVSRLRLSAATAATLGAADGDRITVSNDRGSITLPLAVTPMPDRVVWVPTASAGSHVRPRLAAAAGALVSIRKES